MNQSEDIPATALPVAGAARTWKQMWLISQGQRFRLLCVVTLGTASAAIGLVIPAVIGWFLDGVQNGTAEISTLAWAGVVMAGAAVIGALGSASTAVLAGHSYHVMLADLRERLVERAMLLPQGVVERAGTGDLVSRSSDDVAEIADAAPEVIPALTTTGFTVAVTLVGMTILDLWYGLALLVVLPVYVVTVRWYLRTGPRIYGAERAAMSVRAQNLLESQRGYATVLGFGLTEQRHRGVLAASWSVVRHTLRTQTVQNMFFGRLNIAEFLGMAGILLAGFVLIQNGQSTVGAATTAMLLFLRLFGPINQLLSVVDVLQSVLASLSRMVGVITMPIPQTAASSDHGVTADDHSAHPRPAVRLEGVEFRYDASRPALDDVWLSIRPGERVAVVGSSGAGKTTLAGVVAGLREPQVGTVTRPAHTAVITQEVHVFAGTLRENLSLASPHAAEHDVRVALELTGAAGLIEQLPEGLDTLLGANGSELTPAQSQQVALARVLLADPDLAIFDEATAEAGSTDADVLDRAADAALSNRTAIVIAHRLSQASTCDRILVMDRGRIIEQGTHQDLLDAGGMYAGLWSAWAAASDN